MPYPARHAMQHIRIHGKQKKPSPQPELTPAHTLPQVTRKPESLNPNCSSFSTDSKQNSGVAPPQSRGPVPSAAQEHSAPTRLLGERDAHFPAPLTLAHPLNATGNDFKSGRRDLPEASRGQQSTYLEFICNEVNSRSLSISAPQA